LAGESLGQDADVARAVVDSVLAESAGKAQAAVAFECSGLVNACAVVEAG
jgi:hypothetical protein